MLVLINLLITDATLSINVGVWGEKADLATIYYVAHLLTVSGAGSGAGSSGPVIKKKVGDLEKQFASPNTASYSSDLGTTLYGRRFLALRKEIVKTPIVINFNQDYNT